MKLLLGSGSWHWEGWLTVDASPASGANIIATIPPLPAAVCESEWDVIMAIHFIEHLPLWKAKELLEQCYMVLKPGGKLILEQPDIAYCARVLLGEIEPPEGGQPGQFSLWGLYGDPTHQDVLMLHRWGYTESSLKRLLIAAGFEVFKVSAEPAQFHQPVRDFRIEATK